MHIHYVVSIGLLGFIIFALIESFLLSNVSITRDKSSYNIIHILTHTYTHMHTHNLSRLTINIDGWVSRISLPWLDAFCISSSYVYYDKGQSK